MILHGETETSTVSYLSESSHAIQVHFQTSTISQETDVFFVLDSLTQDEAMEDDDDDEEELFKTV